MTCFWVSHVRADKMFGFRAYYVGKKLCICLYEQIVGIKPPEQFSAIIHP
jgi:hypothetical protein